MKNKKYFIKRTGIKPIFLFFLLAVAVGCDKKKEDSEKEKIGQTEQVASYNYVDTMRLVRSDFQRQVICNGRLRALSKSELSMPAPGVLVEIHAKNGSFVKKGDLLAKSDPLQASRELEKAERELEKAQVELTDKLIGLGYDEDLTQVPKEVLKRTEVTSGYYAAKYQLQTAKTALRDCNLYAPFSGRVANLEGRLHQKAEKFCTLIDDSWFDVEFSVLEAELAFIHLGQQVEVSPFVDEDEVFEGTVSEINPTVDEKGLIKICAKIRNKGNRLVDGMNVRVIAENTVPDMFVVPKDAVVERDGYHVVFCYKDGHAVWTYVDVAYSNLSSYAITGCKKKETEIKVGDVVITSGNLNLADDTEVIPRAQEQQETAR